MSAIPGINWAASSTRYTPGDLRLRLAVVDREPSSRSAAVAEIRHALDDLAGYSRADVGAANLFKITDAEIIELARRLAS